MSAINRYIKQIDDKVKHNTNKNSLDIFVHVKTNIILSIRNSLQRMKKNLIDIVINNETSKE